ncbi:MAG: bifunctional phosphopantothenoylcysteine decarboxylase/phosphopantothenate--cysteine ligase CoaBC [Acidobacteria bacterium]|nr:bifunctional phosphopantothenoylcysteine decarboxylase/phosphopantothenate--cysteine ligase CoaBC [Acidobacteriota bacterium]
MNTVLGVSGGIAAYKAPDLVRRLREVGADVRVILTPNAARFVSALSIAAVSDHPVISDQWGDPSRGGVDHIEIARWADLLLIAPATANVIAKLASGIADDALTTYAIAHRGRLVIAPAMNTFMYGHPTVRDNLARLRERGVEVLDPDSGLLACGDEGEGRMPDPSEIARWVAKRWAETRDLEGLKILVTAGPTREPIDPVRFISNRSSGRMGYAIAAAARDRGAKVILVSGPVAIPAPAGVTVEPVVTSRQMRDAVLGHAPKQDVIIKAAAVADWEAAEPASQKIKKDGRDEFRLELRRTPDILAELGALDSRPFLVAFAAETADVEAHATQKLRRKNADLIVANDVSDPAIGFDSEQNEVVVIGRDGQAKRIARASKGEIADALLDMIQSSMRKEKESVG